MPVGTSKIAPEPKPTDYEYYYNFFPGYRKKYEIKEELED